MSKTIKVSVACPQCAIKLAVPITENDVGQKKQCMCSKCNKIFMLTVPQTLMSKFGSDPTCINSGDFNDISLVLTTVPSEQTSFQSFELTSDYYVIGRKNSSGPEYRSDVEIETSDIRMSRKHAAIKKKGSLGFTLRDLGSKNGVILNNTKLEADEEVYLSDGDVFQIGDTRLRVCIADRLPDSSDLTR